MASYCNVLVHVTNKRIVPWTIVTVEPFNEFQGFIYSNKVRNIFNYSTLLELSSSILNSPWTRQVYCCEWEGKDSNRVYFVWMAC